MCSISLICQKNTLAQRADAYIKRVSELCSQKMCTETSFLRWAPSLERWLVSAVHKLKKVGLQVLFNSTSSSRCCSRSSVVVPIATRLYQVVLCKRRQVFVMFSKKNRTSGWPSVAKKRHFQCTFTSNDKKTARRYISQSRFVQQSLSLSLAHTHAFIK